MKQKKENGFTLVEALVSLGIFAVLMAIASGIFFMVLRGRAKALATRELREAGNGAVLAIEDYLKRYAERCEGNNLIGSDGFTTIFSCTNGQIASNSAILTPATVTCSNFSVNCNPSSFGYSQVTVNFVLTISNVNQELKGALGINEQNFSTTIFLRGKKQ